MLIPMAEHEIILKAKCQNVIVWGVVVDEVEIVKDNNWIPFPATFKIIKGKIYRNKYKKKRNINESESLYEYNGYIKEVDNDIT